MLTIDLTPEHHAGRKGARERAIRSASFPVTTTSSPPVIRPDLIRRCDFAIFVRLKSLGTFFVFQRSPLIAITWMVGSSAVHPSAKPGCNISQGPRLTVCASLA